ncbi:MAG TPA: hypothetical protein VM409_03525 [Chloroflexia bacterium]|nr:hypothetical protein [Chloroflexia bacterium]
MITGTTGTTGTAGADEQGATPAVVENQGPGSAERTYNMSRDGRRQATVLLLGVASIWIFALWSLITILEGGLTGVEWVSGLLMIGILLVAPLVAWALLEELNSRITLGPDGLRYTTLGGIDLAYKWEQISGFQGPAKRGRVGRFFLGKEEDEPVEELEAAEDEGEDESEPGTRLLQIRGEAPQIANPLVRFLHSQANDNAIPLYEGFEDLEDLLARVNARLVEVAPQQ